MRRELTKRTIGPDEVLAIAHGGTSSSSDLEAVEEFNALTIPELNAINGVIAKEADGSINKNHIPNEIYAANPHHLGDKYLSVVVGTVNQFQITDYNSWATYVISAKYGLTDVVTSLDALTGMITFTAPTTIGTVKLNVNEKVYNVSVVPDHPATPVINSPINNSVDRPRTNTASATQFGMVGSGTDVQIGTDWEVATDVGFSNVIISSYNDTVNKNTFTFTVPNLNTRYYIRVRYKGQNTGHTGWSDVVSFTTKLFKIPLSEIGIITPTSATAGSSFGTSVDMNGSGDIIAVGAPFADATATDSSDNSGAVFIFSKGLSGYSEDIKITNFSHVDKITATITGNGYLDVIGKDNVLIKRLTSSDSGVWYNFPEPIRDIFTITGKGADGGTFVTQYHVLNLYFDASDGWVSSIGGTIVTIMYAGNNTYTFPQTIDVYFDRTDLVDGNYINDFNDTGIFVDYTIIGGYIYATYKFSFFGQRTSRAVEFSSSYSTVGQATTFTIANDFSSNSYSFAGGSGAAAVVKTVNVAMGQYEHMGKDVVITSDGTEVIASKINLWPDLISNPPVNGGKTYDYGSIDIFKQVSGVWSTDIQGRNVDLGNTNNRRDYGYSVAMDNAGTIMAVGNPDDIGEVIIYVKVGFTWTFSTKLNNTGRKGFGRSMVMSGNGDYLAIQNLQVSPTKAFVSVFKRNGGTYSLVYETSSDISTEALTFGNSLAFDQQGERLLIGVCEKEIRVLDPVNTVPTDSQYFPSQSYSTGRVLIFKRNLSGSFTLETTITSPITTDTSFGRSLSINADGDIIAIGAPDASSIVNGNTTLEGMVYIHHRDLVNNTWISDVTLVPSVQLTYNNYQTGFEFGAAVSLNDSGSLLAVGAPGYRANIEQNLAVGAVFIFA